jgi:hypothetical protein
MEDVLRGVAVVRVTGRSTARPPPAYPVEATGGAKEKGSPADLGGGPPAVALGTVQLDPPMPVRITEPCIASLDHDPVEPPRGGPPAERGGAGEQEPTDATEHAASDQDGSGRNQYDDYGNTR